MNKNKIFHFQAETPLIKGKNGRLIRILNTQLKSELNNNWACIYRKTATINDETNDKSEKKIQKRHATVFLVSRYNNYKFATWWAHGKRWQCQDLSFFCDIFVSIASVPTAKSNNNIGKRKRRSKLCSYATPHKLIEVRRTLKTKLICANAQHIIALRRFAYSSFGSEILNRKLLATYPNRRWGYDTNVEIWYSPGEIRIFIVTKVGFADFCFNFWQATQV